MSLMNTLDVTPQVLNTPKCLTRVTRRTHTYEESIAQPTETLRTAHKISYLVLY